MTTRAQLESEREALRRVREYTDLVTEDEAAAITASIARVEALLSLSDEEVALAVAAMNRAAHVASSEAGGARFGGMLLRDAYVFVDLMREAEALRTVANLIRREPRGDV